jgi:uncharacterized protein YbaR (Trm112 family)
LRSRLSSGDKPRSVVRLSALSETLFAAFGDEGCSALRAANLIEVDESAFCWLDLVTTLVIPFFCFNTPMAGPRREVKLPYRELNIACPHCRAPLVVGTVMQTILLSQRTCPKCHKEFLIENDVPKKLGSEKKPSESVRSEKTNRRKQK